MKILEATQAQLQSSMDNGLTQVEGNIKDRDDEIVSLKAALEQLFNSMC